MSRFDDRKARAREKRRLLQRAHTYPAAWVVFCALVVASFVGLLALVQSLQATVARLEKQTPVAVPARQPQAATCKVRGDWQPNTTTKLTIDGRDVYIHTPQGFTATDYQPLLMVFSGKSARAQDIQRVFGLDTLPALVVYPEPTIGNEGVTAWQGAPYSSSANDIAFTRAILDELEAQLCVDRTHTYATGFSNGGGFVALLSCDLSDRFTAYAVVAGAMYPPIDNCQPTRPVSLLNIHGDRDGTVPYHGSLTRKLPDIDNWASRRAAQNGCSRTTTAPLGATILATTWTGCRDTSIIKNLRIQGGIHAWGTVPNAELWQLLNSLRP